MIEAYIARYGLLAIFLGAGVEGEAVVVTGGVFAQRGLVPLVGAMIAATIGSTIVDQLWFWAGRRFRNHLWVQRITQKPAFARAHGWLERYPTAFILSFRFIYGMRTISPIAIGLSQIPARRFVPLNMLAAAIWAPTFTLIGFWLGHAAAPLIDRIARVGLDVVVALAVLALLIAAIIALRRRARSA